MSAGLGRVENSRGCLECSGVEATQMERTFTVITPTILRPTLLDTCRSVEEQNYTRWQHIVMIDIPALDLTAAQRELLAAIEHPRRLTLNCELPHRNFGNTCRHDAFKHIHGDYLLYLDDDDVYSGEIFRTLDAQISDEVWGVFPVERLGSRFFNLPPRSCFTCSNQFFCKPLHPWPDNDSYCADGELIDFLCERYPYLVVNSEPLARVRAIGGGK